MKQPEMTLREYYAGLFLQKMLENWSPTSYTNPEFHRIQFCMHAVKFADEIILQLEKLKKE